MLTTLSIFFGVIASAIALIYIQNSRTPTLGVVEGKLRPLSNKPNCVSSQTENSNKHVEPLPFKDSPENTIAALKSTIDQMPGTSIKDEQDDYIHVVYTTPTMKYRDDVEFYLDRKTNEVHFRSASRAGYSDMGANKKRYKEISKLYSAIN